MSTSVRPTLLLTQLSYSYNSVAVEARDKGLVDNAWPASLLLGIYTYSTTSYTYNGLFVDIFTVSYTIQDGCLAVANSSCGICKRQGHLILIVLYGLMEEGPISVSVLRPKVFFRHRTQFYFSVLRPNYISSVYGLWPN